MLRANENIDLLQNWKYNGNNVEGKEQSPMRPVDMSLEIPFKF